MRRRGREGGQGRSDEALIPDRVSASGLSAAGRNALTEAGQGVPLGSNPVPYRLICQLALVAVLPAASVLLMSKV